MRVDDGADLGVRAVGGEQRDLDLGLGDFAGVGVWVGEDVVVGEECFEALEGAGGEVWVEVVLGDKSFGGLGCVLGVYEDGWGRWWLLHGFLGGRGCGSVLLLRGPLRV